MNKIKHEALVESLMDVFTDLEDVISVFADTRSSNDSVKTMLDMLHSMRDKLDLSNVRERSEQSLNEVLAERIGQAYGIYVKLLGMANRAKAEHKDIAYLHGELESMGASLKQIIKSVSELK